MHWYKGDEPRHFIEDVEAVHKAYGLPIWVTEYAVQDHAESEKSPRKFSQAKVDRFINETSHWMDKTSYVERYAWHNSGVGTSALVDDQGNLTATGKTYAEMH